MSTRELVEIGDARASVDAHSEHTLPDVAKVPVRRYTAPYAHAVARHAATHGVRPTARRFGIPRTTVHKWRVCWVPSTRKCHTERQRLLRALARNAPLALHEVARAMRRTDVHGVARLLYRCAEAGEVVRMGARRSYRYALPPVEQAA